MKRLLFTVSSTAIFMMMSGCGGVATGAFKSSDGKTLTTASGAAIVVVDKDPAPVETPVIAPNATMKDRIDVREKASQQRVEIRRTEAEWAVEIQSTVLTNLQVEIRRVVKVRTLKELWTNFKTVAYYKNGHLVIHSSVLRKMVKQSTSAQSEHQGAVTEGTLVALRALLEQQLLAMLEKEVYPNMVKMTMDRIEPAVRECVGKGEFAKAREYIWNASTSEIDPVDEAVRVKAMELMHGLVNPTNWKDLEPKITKVFESAKQSRKWDEGIQQLKDVQKASIVKEYSQFVDKKLAAIKEALKKLNVSEDGMKPIFDKQSALVAAAEKIKDLRDEYKTLEDAKEEKVEKSAKHDPELEEYYKCLDAFHDELIKYNCTKENADRIATDLDKDLMALIDLLRKSAVFETTKTGEVRALQLGTRSLNGKIRKLVADYIAQLEKAKADELHAAFLAKVNKAKADLTEKVKALVDEGKFEEARELIWNAAITGDVEWDTEMFAHGLSLLRDMVNPKDWTRIESEIVQKNKELTEAGKFKELEQFLKDYPLIRQHTVKLDDQLLRVKEEAEALGADPKKAEEVARYVCQKMVTEAEDLVDHLDKLVADAAVQGKGVDKSKFQEELKIYAVKLAAYHATPANVEQIVKKLEMGLNELIANPTNPQTTHLVLGTNAVNDRIRKLVADLLAKIPKNLHDYQDAEQARLITDLEKRVRKAVKEQRFADARNYIRDAKMVGRKDLDIALYELRVGLLDSCVNPAQLDFLLAEIDAKIKAFVEKKDYDGAIAYANDYPYVHDQYAQIEEALAAVKNAMLALEIPTEESDKDEKVRFFNDIQEILEKRRETWKPERDLNEVEKALTQVAKALFDHLNKHPDTIENTRATEYRHILADIAALDRTITTWELNERLRARLNQYLNDSPDGRPGLLSLQKIAEYRKLVNQIDEEISFDSQIAMAEEAISRQLGIVDGDAIFEVNALLGEYARLFRILKRGEKLSADQATTILLGGAYLDQAQVVANALKLGANVNGVSSRDPRGRTPLALAIDAGHSALVKPLVEAGASLSSVDKAGNTIMHYAAKSGNLSVLKAVTAGSPVNVKNTAGDTPLAIAVKRNQAAVVAFIIAAESKETRTAFVNCANNAGDTAFDVAATCGARDVLDTLVEAGATYGEKDLLLAAAKNNLGVTQWLVNHAVDVNGKDVASTALCGTKTKQYLVHEGLVVPTPCACAVCEKARKIAAEKAAKKDHVKSDKAAAKNL